MRATKRPTKDLILSALARSSLPLSSRQLCERIGISLASTSASLSKMSRAGEIIEAGKDGNTILWRIKNDFS